jgi:hypothetical protein
MGVINVNNIIEDDDDTTLFKCKVWDIEHDYRLWGGRHFKGPNVTKIYDDFSDINSKFHNMYDQFGEDKERIVAMLYQKSAQLTAEICEMTYYICPSDDEKSDIIQTLATLRKTTTITGWMLYDIVREDKVSDLLDQIRVGSGYNRDILFYRCLLHMYDSDVGEAEQFYGLDEFGNYGEHYNDVELYDEYINYDNGRGPSEDPYINTYDKCFSNRINYVNRLYWWK